MADTTPTYSWSNRFLALHAKCLALYQGGNEDFASWFTAEEDAFLKSIGYRQREFFDFIEDLGGGADLPASIALLVAAARRDYFLVIQNGVPSTNEVQTADLPAKDQETAGIVWLPRIIVKARAKLRGEMNPDLMYGCGGDRRFFTKHDIDPADFLRTVWAAGDDDTKILDYVKSRPSRA